MEGLGLNRLCLPGSPIKSSAIGTKNKKNNNTFFLATAHIQYEERHTKSTVKRTHGWTHTQHRAINESSPTPGC